MDNFQQTVDLREKMERQKPASPAGGKAAATPLENIYREEKSAERDLQKFSRPEVKPSREGLIKPIVFALAILIVGASVYFLFYRSKGAAVNPKARAWYAIKLVDGEIFYGQVFDVKADPVVIANVYYDYDQAKQNTISKSSAETGPPAGPPRLGEAGETGNLRLVKRGKETHGPDGSMNVVRAQVLYLEPLKADSKVLKAILEYEK